jgi:hypothetical protein
MNHLLLILGLLVFAYACRTFENRWIAKLGWIVVLGTTYLGGFFLTGSHACGLAALAAWFLLPWVEIVSRVRKLRFPLHSEIRHRFPPSREVFPDLDEITAEVEEAGFEQTDDAGWKWEQTDHFVRLFYHPKKKLQANIHVAQQEGMVLSHASLTTRVGNDVTYATTNYPFSMTMKLAPEQHLNRCQSAETFGDMMESHEAFLTRSHVKDSEILPADRDDMSATLAQDLGRQIQHNLSAGVIVRADEEHFRYTWRGCFYLWFEVVKDMLRV